MNLKYKDTKEIKAIIGGVIGTIHGISVRERKWSGSYTTVRRQTVRTKCRRVTVRANKTAAPLVHEKRLTLAAMGLRFNFYGLMNRTGTRFKEVTSAMATIRG